MLTLTENASSVIKQVVENGESNGVRIAQPTQTDENFTLAAAAGPEVGDQVVEDNGARVYLESNAADTLSDKVLDAQVDSGGGVQFVIGGQTDANPPGQGPTQ
jgi:iron-sulfur cluster assembly protein